MHDTPLIFTIATCLAVAFIFGFAAFKLKFSPIAGYLLAGILIGPYTPGLVADTELAVELSEIGIILLMFGVGLHFSVKDLLSVRRIALLGALPQVVLSTVLGIAVALLWHWQLGAALIFGLAISAASTVVVINGLEQRGTLKHLEGKIAIGWLLVQDLAMVLMLVLLPALGPITAGASLTHSAYQSAASALGLAVVKAAVFVVLMLVVGRRVFPWLLTKVANTGSRELFTLFVIAVPIGVALAAAQLFQVSWALGAFFAGIVLNESDLSHRAAAKALPLQDAFAVLFFVSTGMLFNPSIFLTHPVELLVVIAIVLFANPLISFVLTVLLRYPISAAAEVSANFCQIGEFSLIVATLGRQLNMLPEYVYALILGAVLVSISANSLMYKWLVRMGSSLQAVPALAKLEYHIVEDPRFPTLTNHVVLVGYGRVGSRVGQAMLSGGVPFVVIEQDREVAAELDKKQVPCIEANAEHLSALEQADVGSCRVLIVTANDPYEARVICERAYGLNNAIRIMVRTHSEEERHYLADMPGVELVVFGENELASVITAHVST